MKAAKKNKYNSAKVEENVLYDAKVICVIKKVNISDYITEAVRKENAKMKQKA